MTVSQSHSGYCEEGTNILHLTKMKPRPSSPYLVAISTDKGMVRSDISKPALILFFTARVHTTKSTVKIVAAKTHCKYFLKIAEVTNFFCTWNRLYQRFVQSFLAFKHSRDVTAQCNVLC
jgi:hypothetical protein